MSNNPIWAEELISELEEQLAAVEKERDEYEQTADESEEHLRILGEGYTKWLNRAEAAEALCKRACEFVEDCTASLNEPFAERAQKWLEEVKHE